MADQFGYLGYTNDNVNFYEEIPPSDAYLQGLLVEGEECKTLYNHLQVIDLAFTEHKVDRAIFCTSGIRFSRTFSTKFNSLQWNSCVTLGYSTIRPDVWQYLQQEYLNGSGDPSIVHPEVIRDTRIYAINKEYATYLLAQYKKPFINYTGPRNLDLLTLYSGSVGGTYAYPPLAITPSFDTDLLLASRNNYY